MATQKKKAPRPRADRGQGRPKLPPEQRRSVAVQILLTPREAERVDAHGRELSPAIEVTRAEVIRAVLREKGILESLAE